MEGSGEDSDEDRNEMMLEPQQEHDSGSSGEEEQFDIALAASHSYMGAGMICMSGRCVLEPGWVGSVPVMGHHGTVFPGETVPMLLTHHQDIELIEQALQKDKLFGLLCPNETGSLVSGYGVLCEVYEAGVRRDSSGLTFKARATQRFRLLDRHTSPPPIMLYSHMRPMEVRVLPELSSAPLAAARLHSLDSRRHHRKLAERRLEAALTPWPRFLFDMFDYTRMRNMLQLYFKEIMLAESLPEEPVSLSFWVASNLALSARDRLALFTADHALLRLHMELKFIHRKAVLCCVSCVNEIARRENIFPMSSEGVHSNFTNLGGYMHDLVTVSAARGVELSGAPSAQFSWFPGYTWTVALCSHCTKHVGWRFDAMKRKLRPQQFFGLCRNYVQPRQQHAPDWLLDVWPPRPAPHSPHHDQDHSDNEQ